MANWRYKLKHGTALREAIDNEDYELVISELKECFKELHAAIPEDYDEDDLERDIADIEDFEYMVESIEDENDEEDLINEIDSKLNDLYDLCDALRVWVEF